jgi:hypothetical protein
MTTREKLKKCRKRVPEPVLRKHEVKREVDWEQSVIKCSCPGDGGGK